MYDQNEEEEDAVFQTAKEGFDSESDDHNENNKLGSEDKKHASNRYVLEEDECPQPDLL